MTDYEKIKLLVDALLKAYDKEDPDYKAAEPFLSSIKEIFECCYSYSGFCNWLAGRDMDILIDFRFANIVSKEDYKNPDDWEEAKENALFVSNDGTSAVMSWEYPAL